MIRLPNGNVVKFSHTKRKHFTVGDPKAFPIVKMGNPQSLPFPCTTWTPSNTAMARTTARTTPNLSSDGWSTIAHVRRKVDIGYNGAPQIRPQKWTNPQPHYLPHPLTRPTYDAKLHPEFQIRSAVFPQCTGQTDGRTYVRTDRQIVHGKVWRL